MRNPYEAPPDDVRLPRTCPCCGLPYLLDARAPRSCLACAHHIPGIGAPETLEQETDRLREDLVIVRKFADKAHGLARRANEANKDLRRADPYVAEQRDRWRSLAFAMGGEHVERPDGSCTCGAPRHDRCPTVRAGLEADAYLLKRQVWEPLTKGAR